MAEISGDYGFHGRDPYVRISISAMADGTLDGLLVEDETSSSPVHGTYDAASSRVTFSEGATPGVTLLNTFFKGFAITDANDEVVALAGTWTHQRLSYSGLTFNGVVYDNGGWYADGRVWIR